MTFVSRDGAKVGKIRGLEKVVCSLESPEPGLVDEAVCDDDSVVDDARSSVPCGLKAI